MVSTERLPIVFLPTLLQWTQTFFLPLILQLKCFPLFSGATDKFSILRRLAEAVDETPPINALAMLALKCFTFSVFTPLDVHSTQLKNYKWKYRVKSKTDKA